MLASAGMGKRKVARAEGPLYTLKFAARAIGVDVSTVRRWCSNKRMGVQPGGPGTGWMVTRGDLEKALKDAAREVLG